MHFYSVFNEDYKVRTEKLSFLLTLYVKFFNYLCSMINVRKNLKAIIVERGLSQKQIAFECGMKESALSTWLSSDNDASLRKTSEICEAMGISIVDALTYPQRYIPEDSINPACEECKKKDEIIENLSELLRRYKAEAKQKPKKE